MDDSLIELEEERPVLMGQIVMQPGYVRAVENPNDVFDTPYEVARSAVFDVLKPFWDKHYLPDFKRLPERKVLHPKVMLDPGAGSGVWGNAMHELFPNTGLVGIDVRDLPHTGHYHWWYPRRNYLDYNPVGIKGFDLIVSNPPYGISEGVKGDWAERFFHKSWSLLNDHGVLMMLLKTVFLEGVGRRKSLFSKFPLKEVHVSTRRIHWRKNKHGKKSANTISYALFIWHKSPSIDYEKPMDPPLLYWWDYLKGTDDDENAALFT